MIPEAAVEAATEALLTALSQSGPGAYIQEDDGPSNCVIDGFGLDVPACVTKALEAAAPHMQLQALEDRELVEERVKAIVQEVAMTVDYTDRLYKAVQEIMAVTRG